MTSFGDQSTTAWIPDERCEYLSTHLLGHTIDLCRNTTSDIARADEPLKALARMRADLASFEDFYNTLLYNQATSNARMRHLLDAINGLKCSISSTAMNYGINRLPNEILLRVLLDAADGLMSTIVLSHVCRHFRSMIIGSHEFWERFELSSSWSREQIFTIAGRTAPRPLRAVIRFSGYLCPKDLDPITAILDLSFRIQELSLYAPDTYRDGAMLQSCIQRSRFPLLKVMSFSQTIPVVRPPFDMPSLQSLEADFLPSPSYAQALVKLTLTFQMDVSLGKLLSLLSSANGLQELEIHLGHIGDTGSASNLPIISMRSIDTFHLAVRSGMELNDATIIPKKIRAPSLRKLGIHLDKAAHGVSEESVHSIMLGYPSIQYLEISGIPCIDLHYVSQNVEELTFGNHEGSRMPLIYASGPLGSSQIRLLHFERLNRFLVSPNQAILSIRDLFRHRNAMPSF